MIARKGLIIGKNGGRRENKGKIIKEKGQKKEKGEMRNVGAKRRSRDRGKNLEKRRG